MLSQCKGCGQEIIWTQTESGAKMPLNASPVATYQPGHFVLNAGVCASTSAVYLNHWATCPSRGQFKTGGAA